MAYLTLYVPGYLRGCYNLQKVCNISGITIKVGRMVVQNELNNLENNISNDVNNDAIILDDVIRIADFPKNTMYN